jgi:hypothetical protein
MQLELKDIYNIHYGIDMDNYLWSKISEDDEELTVRKSKTSYENWLKKASQIIIGYTMGGSTYTARNNAILYGIDTYQMTRELIEMTLVLGTLYVLVTSEGIKYYEPFRVKQEKDKPHQYMIDGENPIYIDTEAATIRQGDKQDTLQPGEWQIVKYNPRGESFFKDVASSAVKLFNLESNKDYLQHVSQFWYLVTTPTDKAGILPRPQSLLEVPVGARAEFIMPQVEEKIRANSEECDKLIMKIGRTLGLEAEFLDDLTGKFGTGVAKAFSMIDIGGFIAGVAAITNLVKNTSLAALWKRNGYRQPVPSISLDPKLRPTGDSEAIREFDEAAKIINRPIAWKLSKMEIAKIKYIASDQELLAELLADIRANGGQGPYNEFAAAIGEDHSGQENNSQEQMR